MQKRHLFFIVLLTVIMPWVSRAQETLTVYEGTSTSNVIPAYIFYFDDFTRSQFVIPAADLEIMSGGTITSIKFYTTDSNIPYTTVSTADVYLKEVDYTSISAFAPKTNIVYQGTLDVVSEDGAGSLTIELATPYTYGGGNLLVGIENITDAGWKNISFYGTFVTGASVGASDGSSIDNVTPTQRDFIPKTTFTYIEPAPATPSCNPSFSRTSDYIASFSLGSISNTNSGFSSGGYGNFASMSTELEQGSTVNASLTSSDGSGDHFVGVWIDFNNDGTFDESTEKVSNYSTSIGPSVTVQIPLEIPDNAALGNHIMRVLYRYNQAPTPCISASFGEGEDYMVKIAPTYITEINDENDWEAFCEAVNSGHTYSGATVNLNADISVTTMAGTSTNVQVGRNAFRGIFEGHGHTLTIDLVKGTSTHTAPFVYINGATIKDLKVEGEINIGDNQLAGGLVGISVGTNTITNCKVNVTINSSVSGDGTHGGFISLVQGGIITFNGCAFTGKLLGANTHSCGGFVGYSRGTSKFFNCVFAPQQLSFDSNNCSTFARNGNSFTNCYYTDALGTVQGKEMFTITSLSPVTVAMSDTATNTYDVSDINTYTAGIVYGNTIYAGDGDTISLTLTGADLYGVDHGELMVGGQNYTLVMAAYNTLISEVSCSVPTGLVVTTDSETPYGATITWTENGYATAWIVEYADNDAFTNSAVEDANGILTHTFSGLDSETTYYVRVRANCGGNDGTSGWSIPTTFTTLEACPAPNVVVNNITHTNATVAWIGFSDSYTVALGHEGEPITLFIDFEDQTVPTGWTLNNDTAWIVVEGNGGYCLQSNNAGLSNSTSSISLTYMYYTNGTIEFDAECMGEGTNSSSSYWDHCDFYIDETRALYAGANISGWNHYTFNVTKGEHTFTWSYTKDGTVNPSGDYFAVDNVTLNSANLIWESPSIIENTEHTFDSLTVGTDYFVKVQSICDDIQSEESIVIFSTLPESQRVFVTEGNWNNAANWSGDIPNINNEVIVRANATVPSGCVAEADNITFEGTPMPTLTIADGGQLKANSNVTATVKKNITGYGIENVDTNNGYYLIATPTTHSTSASDAGLITTTADNEPTYDLYGWDRTATDEEWQNTKNFDYYYLYNGNGYLYANLNDMEMSVTGTMLRSDEPVTMTAYYDSIAGGWNLFGNPFPCNAYVYRLDGAPMDVMVYDTNGEMVTLNCGPIAPMQGFFVKVMETTTVVIKSMPAYVDLGLPSGLLWATCNVGATTPEGSGDYFAWGETQPKDYYDWNTYQYCNGSETALTKYCYNSNYGYNGFIDNLATLLPEDDAASANWGAGWRTPSSVEWAELYNNTTNTWTTQNGVCGRLFTAPNGTSLFLPAAGYRDNSNLYDAGSFSYYWSSSLNTADPDCAKHFGSNSDYYGVDYNGRRYGYAVRAVRPSVLSTSFTATTEHQGGRTILDPNNGQVNWTAGDQMVIGNANGETAVFSLQSGEGMTEGVFAASNGFGTVGPFIAAYPSDAVIENDKVTFNLLSTQAIAETETFANGANLMVAHSDDNNLSFKNLCGGLGIRLKGVGAHVTAIRITSMDTTEKLWGTYEVNNCAADEPSLTMASGNQGTNVITLTCDVMLTTAAKTFFVMLPPGTLAAGFTVEVFDGEEILTTMETTGDAFSVERNSLKFFNEILIDMEFDGNVEIPSDLNNMDIVVTNLGGDAVPNEDGDFAIGYSRMLVAQNADNGNIIYYGLCSIDENIRGNKSNGSIYELNAKETAIMLALRLLPFDMSHGDDEVLQRMKEIVYSLSCVQELETAVQNTVNTYGYLKEEGVAAAINAVADFFYEQLSAVDIDIIAQREINTPEQDNLETPHFYPTNHKHGVKLHIKDSQSQYLSNPDRWSIKCTGYSSLFYPVRVAEGYLDPTYNIFTESPNSHSYILPPISLSQYVKLSEKMSLLTTLGWLGYLELYRQMYLAMNDEEYLLRLTNVTLDNMTFVLPRSANAIGVMTPRNDDDTYVLSVLYRRADLFSIILPISVDDIFNVYLLDAEFMDYCRQQPRTKAGINNILEAMWNKFGDVLLSLGANLPLDFANAYLKIGAVTSGLDALLSRLLYDNLNSFSLPIVADYYGISLPTVHTAVLNVSQNSATLVGTVEGGASESVVESGFVYGDMTSSGNTRIAVGAGTGSFETTIGGLLTGNQYHAMAYAKLSNGEMIYGEEITFTPYLTVTTFEPSVTSTAAAFYGAISNYPGLLPPTILEHGFSYGTVQDQNYTVVNLGPGEVGTTFATVVEGLAPNTDYTVIAFALLGISGKTVIVYGDEVDFTTLPNDGGGNGSYNGHDYVDLGLPSGTLWATCNVGASSPEDYGDYYAWGETTTKDRYLENYQYSCMGGEIWGLKHLTKYCNNSTFGCNGFTDNLTTLQPEDDAATANWGEGWRMATYEEWNELLNNTTNTWTTRNGVNGRLFTASNGASLFLPAAGGRWDGALLYTGGGGYYWSSSLGLVTPDGACFLNISEAYYADHLNNGYYRCYGFSVRPVHSVRQN